MPSVELPPKTPGGPKVTVDDVRTVVIVGANGTGKTRMGAYIEKATLGKTHRIGAQRALVIPAHVPPRAYDQAQSQLHYGNYEPNWKPEQRAAHKIGGRWGGEPFTQMLNDYEHVLGMLFADEAKTSRDYYREALKAVPKEQPPRCKLNDLAEIWAVVMPQRELTIFDDRLETKSPGGTSYQARHMSDGERVAVYLIGQSLCAPENGIIVIDEPELHLHRAIQGLLWDEIEAKRPDCAFVYITHDLDFAATRFGARRIWLKEFDGKDWVWDEIAPESGIPDALLMQVMGSRRPVVFVEGDENSHDVAIYTALFPGELVASRTNCNKVIEATKTMTSLPAFHHLAVRGLVDRDRRSDEEVVAIRASGVGVAEVAEVENLMCLPEVIEAVAKQLKCDDLVKSRTAAEERVLDELNRQIDQQALARALREIQFRMNGFGPKIGKSDAARLEADLQTYVKGIDVAATVAGCKSDFQRIVAAKDYREALRLFNNKGIVSFVAQSLGIEPERYTNLVLKLLREDPKGTLAAAMRNAIDA
jgi:hypothetical protein